MPLRPHLLRLLLCAVALVLIGPQSAWAHARLERTSPADGATIARQPTQVAFSFDEAVGGTGDAVHVFDREGHRVDLGNATHPAGAGQTLAVGLKTGLPDGTYTATYRVVSADTHVVTGGSTFSVGAAGARGDDQLSKLLAGQRSGAVTQDAFILAKAVQYGSIGIVGGLLAFLLLVWRPLLRAQAGGTASWQRAGQRAVARLHRLLLLAAAAGVLSAVAGLGLQGAQESGIGVGRALEPAHLDAVLQTRFGTVWGLGLVAWVLVAVGASAALRRPADMGVALRRVALGADGALLSSTRSGRWGAVLLAAPLAGLLWLPALAGHPSVQRPVWLYLPANLVHVTAMALWLGGLLALVAVVPVAVAQLDAEERSGAVAQAVTRFSPLALGSVVVLLGTGTIQALLQIGAWSQLVHTAYGRAVLLKVAALVGLIALGARNRQRTMPRLAGDPRAHRTLTRTVRAELGLLAGVLVLTGALSGYPPAEEAGGGAAVRAGGPQRATVALGDVRARLAISPAAAGPNTIEVRLTDLRGAPATRTRELTLTAALLKAGIGPLAVALRRTGPGAYRADHAVLGVPGSWLLRLTDRVSDFDETTATTTIQIP